MNVDDVCIFYYFGTACEGSEKLGIENGHLPNSRISASSVWWDNIDDFGPQGARLNIDRLWTAHITDNDPWIQVRDLSDPPSKNAVFVFQISSKLLSFTLEDSLRN